MRPADLREMSDGELDEHLHTARRELFGLRFQHATGELDNTAGLARAKREVARALTVQRERELFEYAEPVAAAPTRTATEEPAEPAASAHDATEAQEPGPDDHTEEPGPDDHTEEPGPDDHTEEDG